MKNKIDLGTTHTIESYEHLIIALSKKYLRLNDGVRLEFHVIINESGELVLVSKPLVKLTKTRGDNNDKH